MAEPEPTGEPAVEPASEIPALPAALASRDEEEQERAAAALGEAARRSREEHQEAAAAIEPLAGLLSSPSPKLQLAAAGALRQLASPALAEYIIDAGAAEGLIQLVRSGGDGEVQAAAAAALGALACSQESRQGVREAGALEALLGCLRGSEHETARQAALQALARLAADHASQKALAKAEAVPLLLELAQGGSEALKPAACWLLLDMACGLKAVRKAVVEGGGLPALLPLLRPGQGDAADAPSRLRLARMLASAAGDSRESRKALAAAGCLPALVLFLLEGHQTMAPGRGAAVEALGALCSEDGEAGRRRRQELAGMHGIYALLAFLHASAQPQSGLAQLFRWAGQGMPLCLI